MLSYAAACQCRCTALEPHSRCVGVLLPAAPVLPATARLPADNQSVDRAYRIGQTRDVVVYRLISCGTVEEKVR